MAANSGPQIEPSKQPCSLPNNSCSWTSFRAIPQQNTAVQWLVSFPTPKNERKQSFSYPFHHLSQLPAVEFASVLHHGDSLGLIFFALLRSQKLCLLVKSVATSNWSFFKQKVSETLKMQSTSLFLILLNETNASPPLVFSIGKSGFQVHWKWSTQVLTQVLASPWLKLWYYEEMTAPQSTPSIFVASSDCLDGNASKSLKDGETLNVGISAQISI